MDDRTASDRGPYLPRPKVAERYRTTSRTVERWCADPDLGFPKPLNINGYLYFSEPELIAWEHSRAAEVVSAKHDKCVIKQQRRNRHRFRRARILSRPYRKNRKTFSLMR
jgi:hypothetical protein